jgi:hypothetical protein
MGYVMLGDFPLVEEIKRKTTWLSNRSFDTAKRYLAAVAAKVTEELNEAKRDGRIVKFPTYRRTATGTRWTILTVILAGYFRGVASLTFAEFTHNEGEEADFDVNEADPYRPVLAGSEAVRRAMYPNPGDRADPRFAQYSRELPFRSLEDAEYYVKGFIQASCSDLARELDPEFARITGGQLHLARITPELGFQWVIPPGSMAESA